MKETILDILNKYLEIYPDEYERQKQLLNYINSNDYDKLIDWNNFDGHIVASGFIYAACDNKFLVLYHKDLKMYLYPGGHVELNDKNILEAAKREVQEETGLNKIYNLKIGDNDLIPIDIDTHLIDYNKRLNLPEHYHFDFRYLFIVDKANDIIVDDMEIANYKWINIQELYNDTNYAKIILKINKILGLKNVK